MKQLSHDVRVSYISNEGDTIQNCYAHQLSINNPDSYSSTNITLNDQQTFAIQNCNYLYLAASRPVTIVIDGVNEITVNHLAYVNLEAHVDFMIANPDGVGSRSTELQLLYGRVVNEE
jgi:hypothetical protein